MRSLDFFFLATVLFLELVHKLVLFGIFFHQTVVFSPHVHHPDHPPVRFLAPSQESCMVKIGNYQFYSC